jgi:hypothetical protein
MMAAEYKTLPAPMQDTVVRFFDDNETWLTRVLKQGREKGTLQFVGSPNEMARMIVSGLEGAMLVARPFDDISRFQASARHLLASLTPPSPKAARPQNATGGVRRPRVPR